jgi:hypothetical protein
MHKKYIMIKTPQNDKQIKRQIIQVVGEYYKITEQK